MSIAKISNSSKKTLHNNKAESYSFVLGYSCGKYLKAHNHQRTALAMENSHIRQNYSLHYTTFCKGLMYAGIDVILFGTVIQSSFLSYVKHINLQAGILLTINNSEKVPFDIKVLIGKDFITAQDKEEILHFKESDISSGYLMGFCSEFNFLV